VFNVVYQLFIGSESSQGLKSQHTEVPCHRQTWYPTQSLRH